MTLDETIVNSVPAGGETLISKENDPAIADCDVVLHGNAVIDVTAESFAFPKSEVCRYPDTVFYVLLLRRVDGYPDTVFRMLLLRWVECCVTGCNGGFITLFTILQPRVTTKLHVELCLALCYILESNRRKIKHEARRGDIRTESEKPHRDWQNAILIQNILVPYLLWSKRPSGEIEGHVLYIHGNVV